MKNFLFSVLLVNISFLIDFHSNEDSADEDYLDYSVFLYSFTFFFVIKPS